MTTNVPSGYPLGFPGLWSTEHLAKFILDTVAQAAAPFNDAVITGSTINSSTLGATTASTVHATTLNNTTAAGSAINAASLGATTPGTAAVTALTASGVASFTNASVSMSALPTSDPHVSGRLFTTAGAIQVSAG